MERTVLRFASVIIIFVILAPTVSMAGSQYPREEHPGKPVVSRSEGDVVGVAKVLAFLREIFGDLADVGAGADGSREKDLENRMGIDPNGNS